jgi:BolA protein
MNGRSGVTAGEGQATVADAIKAKLQAAFAPVSLEIIDDSLKHAGHAHVVTRQGVAGGGGGETHFKIKVVSEAFKGKSRVDRHRAINTLLSAELEGGIHALSIDAKAPGE